MGKCIVILLFISCIAYTTFANKTPIVATVNSINILPAELRREMLRCRAAVYDQYHTVNISKLQQQALKGMIIIKVQEQLLQKYHLWRYQNYNQLLLDMENVNRQRQIDTRHSKTVYGPVEYTETGFFDYQFTNAVIKLKRILKISEYDYAELIKRKVKVSHVVTNSKQLAAVVI